MQWAMDVVVRLEMDDESYPSQASAYDFGSAETQENMRTSLIESEHLRKQIYILGKFLEPLYDWR